MRTIAILVSCLLIGAAACDKQERKVAEPDPVASTLATASISPSASAATIASVAPSTSTSTSTSTSASTSASAPAPASFPKIVDLACATDNDCTTTSLWSGDCCGTCELRYANKSWDAKAKAWCAAHPPSQCPPMGCSWGMSKEQCRAGKCQAWKK